MGTWEQQGPHIIYQASGGGTYVRLAVFLAGNLVMLFPCNQQSYWG